MRTTEPEIDHDPTLLDEIDVFVGNCLYVTKEQQTVAVLASAISHDPRVQGAVPRIVVRGKKQCGKSTYMDVGCMLSHNAFMSNCTQAAIRAFYNTDDEHALFLDEASKYFGESGLLGRTLEVYKVLTEGYRKRATLSFSVNRVLTSVSSYGVAWTAGIGESVPEDVVDRGIIINMEAKPESVEKWDTLDDSVWATGEAYQEQLHDWVLSCHDYLVWFGKNMTRRLHKNMTSRRRQIWGQMAGIAYAAGGDWPKRFMEAFLALGIDRGKAKPTTNQQIVLDAAEIVEQNAIEGDVPDFLYTIDLMENLPQRDIYEDWTDEFLVQALSRALGTTRPKRGMRLTGEAWYGKGRDTKPILRAAEEIRAKLWPEEEEAEEDDTDDEIGGPVFEGVVVATGATGATGLSSARGGACAGERRNAMRTQERGLQCQCQFRALARRSASPASRLGITSVGKCVPRRLPLIPMGRCCPRRKRAAR